MLFDRLKVQVGWVEGEQGRPDVLHQLVLVHRLHFAKVEHFCRDRRGVHSNNIFSLKIICHLKKTNYFPTLSPGIQSWA